MKKKTNAVDVSNLSSDELIAKFRGQDKKGSKHLLIPLLMLGILLPAIGAIGVIRTMPIMCDADNEMLSIATAPVAATTSKDLISVPVGIVKQNPFLPYKDLNKNKSVSDVPDFDIIEPPETISEDSDAARIMNTVVSGILFDSYSPSAILNIEGKDYLVKKGDVINNYKVLSILKDSVTVQLGTNTYKAGIGEILTEGAIVRNEVANLDTKFGGKR